MAFFLLELPDAQQKKNGTHSILVEAADATKAKEIASSAYAGDGDWSAATTTEIAAGMAADLAGFRYRVRIAGASGAGAYRDVTYTGVASDTTTTIAAALADLLTGSPVSHAALDDGGVFTDETTAANQNTANDMNFTAATPAAGDAYVFGFPVPFGRLAVTVGTVGTGTYTMAWEYWNGSAWVALAGVTDGTTGFKTVGKNTVVFTVPAAWQKTVLGASPSLYFVRAKIDAGTVTAAPKGTRAWAGPGTLASNSTNTLTAAAIADGLGDRALLVDAFLPGSENPLNVTLVGTVVDEGVAAAVLTVVLTTPSPIPVKIREFGPGVN
jgi:hypothetical protein